MPKRIFIEICQRDGIWYATSPDMPGFLLSSRERQKLDADIYPAMKKLIAYKEAHTNVVSMNRAADHLVERRELAFA